MNTINNEKRIIMSMCSNGTYNLVLKEQVDESHFLFFHSEFNFIKSYANEYGDVPSLFVLAESAQHPEWLTELNSVEDYPESALLYDIEILKKMKMKRTMIKAIEKSAEQLEQDEVEMAIDELLTELHTLKHEQVKGSISITDGEALNRLEIYSDRVIQTQNAGMIGIPSGLDTYDREIGGWLRGQMVAYIGRLGTGKSWMLMFSAWKAWKEGYRVLFLSPEMPVEETEFRFDAINAGHMNVAIMNSDLTMAKLPDARLYKDYLTGLQGQNRKDFITAESNLNKRFTISGIQAMIFEYKPDIVCVDGVYLMEDEQKGVGSWEKMWNLGYGLKNIAMINKVAVLCTTQANREAAVKEHMIPKADQVSYGDGFAQAADKIFGIAQMGNGMIKIGTIKIRSGRWCPEMLVQFDVDSGNIKELEQADGEGEFF